MTELGIIHLMSILYISFIVCLLVSINENREPKRIIRETLRRWVKFLGVTVAMGILVTLLSSV